MTPQGKQTKNFISYLEKENLKGKKKVHVI